MLKKLNLNLIILSILMTFCALIPRVLLAHSAVSSLHMHMSQYAVSTPESYILTTKDFTFCESYNLATGVCTGDTYEVPSDTANSRSCDAVAPGADCVWASSLNIPAGLTFNYVRQTMMNGYTMKASATYTDAQKTYPGGYYAVESDSCATNSAVTNVDGVIGQGAVNGTASAQVMTGHTAPGNETNNPSAAGEKFSGSISTTPLKLSSLIGSAYENALIANFGYAITTSSGGSAVWVGNADTEIDYIIPLTSTYITTGKQPLLTIKVNVANTVSAQTIAIHAGSTEIIPENCLIWNSGITLDLTLSD